LPFSLVPYTNTRSCFSLLLLLSLQNVSVETSCTYIKTAFSSVNIYISYEPLLCIYEMKADTVLKVTAFTIADRTLGTIRNAHTFTDSARLEWPGFCDLESFWVNPTSIMKKVCCWLRIGLSQHCSLLAVNWTSRRLSVILTIHKGLVVHCKIYVGCSPIFFGRPPPEPMQPWNERALHTEMSISHGIHLSSGPLLLFTADFTLSECPGIPESVL